jgi:excisionase family DNA binding protein
MEEIITPSQVANLLQIHVKTVYRLASEGTIPGNRIGRSWRFSKTDILKLVSGNGLKTIPVSKTVPQAKRI